MGGLFEEMSVLTGFGVKAKELECARWCGGDRGCLCKHRGLSWIDGVIWLGSSQVWQRGH